MSDARSAAPLVVVPPGASPVERSERGSGGVPLEDEEVAAMVAVITVLENERAVALAAAAPTGPSDQLDAWVRASRVSARRTGFSRGPWRLSGRLTRRSRA